MRAFRVADSVIRWGLGSCGDKRGLGIFEILRCSYISFLMSLVIVICYIVYYCVIVYLLGMLVCYAPILFCLVVLSLTTW